MTTAFQDTAFQNNAFQIDAVVTATKVGGDDVPRRKSPDRGWDRKEWERRKADQDAIEATLRQAYAALTTEDAAVTVLAQVDAIVRPAAQKAVQDVPLRIDWAKMARDYERANALVRLWHEEQELKAAMEDEEEAIMLLIH